MKSQFTGSPLPYIVTTGMMPLKGATGETEANVFFVAYHRTDGKSNDADPHRPLVFAFNGGPGSASVWLHLGAIGPKRVQMLPDGGLPPPPYHLVDNEQTWLDQADLVFLDPVGTGYSRPTKPEYGAKFWGLQGDIAAAGDFIRLYLTRYKRWSSPLFLAGESYGTTRAAGLSNYLVEHGIALNGIALLSSVLNFQTLEFRPGNDLPYMLFLPTYTATAWYHHKLPDALQKDLNSTLKEAENWAQTDYANALAQGDRLTGAQRQAVIDKMARYTGLSKTYLDNSDLRVDIESFCKELLRDRKRSVGRLDSRFVGLDSSNVSQTPDFDPSQSAIRPPYTAMMNMYAREELNFEFGRGVLRAGRRHQNAVGLGHTGAGVCERQRISAQRVCQKPVHETVRGGRVLRPGNAVLCRAVHCRASGTRPYPARQHHHRPVCGRPHDVH